MSNMTVNQRNQYERADPQRPPPGSGSATRAA